MSLRDAFGIASWRVAAECGPQGLTRTLLISIEYIALVSKDPKSNRVLKATDLHHRLLL